MKLAKTQVMYAIRSMMELYEREEVSFFYQRNKPTFQMNNCKYEVLWFYIPEMDDNRDLTMEICLHSYSPYSTKCEHLTMKPTDFRGLKTLEKLFFAAADYIFEGYFEDTGFNDAQEMLESLTEDYIIE